MGVVLSAHAQLSRFSLASGVVGLISFAFTLGTFLKVVWVNLETLGEAPHEVHGYLTNLRTELLEERSSLRSMRKGLRQHQRARRRTHQEDLAGIELDDVSLRTLGDSVKSLIRRFRELEKPFLEPGERGIADAPNHRTRARRRNSSPSPPYYNHAAYSSPPEKSGRARTSYDRDWDRERDQWDQDNDDEAYWAQRTKYRDYSLICRLKWLSRKSEAQNLFETLTRIQVRRIALQVGGLTIAMHCYGRETLDMKDTLHRIDDRVSRVVGVRRIDE